MNTATIPAIRHTLTVAVPAERAFQVFTESFDSWWPRPYAIGAAEMAEAVLECRAGGRWYERDVDGTECDWGPVLAWEPPHRLVLLWQINGEWQYDPDPAHGSEVEVRFTADGPGATLVELEHRLLERHGASGATLRDQVGGEHGWGGILRGFAEAAAA